MEVAGSHEGPEINASAHSCPVSANPQGAEQFDALRAGPNGSTPLGYSLALQGGGLPTTFDGLRWNP